MKQYILNLYYDLYYKISDHINGSDAFNLIITSQRMRFLIPTRTPNQAAAVLLWAADLRNINGDSTVEDLSFSWSLRKINYEERVYEAMKNMMDEARA